MTTEARTHKRGCVEIISGNGRTVMLIKVIPLRNTRPDGYEIHVKYAEDAALNFIEPVRTLAAARRCYKTWARLTGKAV